MHKSDKGVPKMRGYNQRNLDGELRKIRDDTTMKTLKDRYGIKFPGRSIMKWGTFQVKQGIGSVKEDIQKFKK